MPSLPTLDDTFAAVAAVCAQMTPNHWVKNGVSEAIFIDFTSGHGIPSIVNADPIFKTHRKNFRALVRAGRLIRTGSMPCAGTGISCYVPCDDVLQAQPEQQAEQAPASVPAIHPPAVATPRNAAQIRHANAHSASRAKTLHWEGYEIEQVDTFTFHILRPLRVVLEETTQSFLKGGDGSEVAAFYVIDAERINEGIVACGCPGYDGWKKCCCHSELFVQAFEAAKLEADARAFAADTAPVVAVTASHPAPVSDGVVTCKKRNCTASVGTSSSCVANRYCKACQRFADFGE